MALGAMALAACAGQPSNINPRAISAPFVNADDVPQLVQLEQPKSCALYARERSGIDIRGDADEWWDKASGRFAEENRPGVGSVMVLVGYAGEKRAHLAVVSKVVSSREIRVDHANWLEDGNLYLNSPVVDVSLANDWSEVKVWNTRDGHMGGNAYTVRGFIAPYGPSYAAGGGATVRR
jgi:surface antigen